MFLRVANVALFLAFLGSLALHALLIRDHRQPNFEMLPEMVHSPAYGTFAPNPNFPDGKTYQAPQPGTIARGQRLLHYGPSPAEAIRAGAKLSNRYSADDPRALERGAFVYANFCQACHGPQGKGNGPVPQRGVPLPASLTAENAVQMKDGQLFHVLTFGKQNMPAAAGQLSVEDRWKVILYVRVLQQQASGEKRP
jgi:mono/diheme cytochrome c family protein